MNKFFTFRSLSAVVAVASVVQGTASAACWSPDEIVADQVKDFQYMLMVGALQCRNSAGAVSDGYNAVVAQQRTVLDAKGYVLKAHFLRENGVAGGRAAYDQAATAMSNRHAGRTDDPSFCQTIAGYTRMAATASDRDFVTLAQAVIEAPVSSCLPAGYVAPVVAPLAPVRRPEPLPLVETAAAAVAMAANDDPYAGEIVAEPRAERAAFAAAPADPVAALPAAPVPAPVVAAATIPVTAIADAPVVPPEARAPSPAAALQAAITALQAAADALKAQSGPTS